MQNLIGQSIGRYRILEQLGEGGMAVVYKAYDTRLDCEVALKIIRTEKITPETAPIIVKRFEIEAQKTASLTHPNIVPVTDYGDYEGTPYLVMKYLPGGTLKRLIGKPIPYQKSIQIILPIAEALDYAHKNRIIHRDVKPANILITDTGIPMLSDFGIAKIIEFQEETLDHLTVTGVGIGTPEYMSPEQAIGKKVDARSDIYALGVVLYELITGRKPFMADTPMAVIIKQTTDPLPSPRNFVPQIPVQMEQILYKALAKNPDDRFANISELIQCLQDVDKPNSEHLLPLVEKKPQPKINKKKNPWLWMLLPLLVAISVAAFFSITSEKKDTIFPTPSQSLQVSSQVFSTTPEPTISSTPTEEPAPNQSILFTNPYAGPVPPGAVFRLGKGSIIDADLSPDGKTLVVA